MSSDTGRQLVALQQMANAAICDVPVSEVAERTVAALRTAFRWEYAALYSVDHAAGKAVLEACSMGSRCKRRVGDEQSLQEGVAKDVVNSGTYQLIDDAQHFADPVSGTTGVSCELWLPIAHGDQVVALLNAGAVRRDALFDHLRLLETVGDLLAGALVNARCITQLRDRATLMEIMTEVARIALESEELKEMLQRTVDYISRRLRVTVASVLMLNSERTHFAFEVARGELQLHSPHVWPISIGVAGRCARTGEPQLITDVANDPDYVPGHESVVAEYLVPIAYRGKVIGVLNLESTVRDVFTPEAQGVFRGVAHQIAGAIHLLAVKDELARTNQENVRLLQNMLPHHAVKELQTYGRVTPRYFRDAAIVFTDIAGFTLAAQEMAAEDLLQVLDGYFSEFDAIVARYGLEKIKTIGDSYMCVAGVPDPGQSSVVDAILAARAFQAVTQSLAETTGLGWRIRVAIHSGPLIAGVIGTQKASYDVWGSTVNLASRVLSASRPGEITVSEPTLGQARDFFEVRDRGKTVTREGLEIAICQVLQPRTELMAADGRGFSKRYELYYRKTFPGFHAPSASAGP